MLQHLHISHYVLIERLDIDFFPGFSIITGETGAGKSIILGALGLLRGERADAGQIKAGEKKCCVEATFDVQALQIAALFEENDIDFDGEECILRREVTSTGKSRAFVNDTPVRLNVLRSFADALIDIHSQHQNLLLGHETFLLDTLDAAAENTAERNAYHTCYEAWSEAEERLETLKAQAAKGRDDADYLSFQLHELTEAALTEGEQEALEREAGILRHAEEIKMGLFEATAPLGGEEHGIGELLRDSAGRLQRLADVYAPALQMAERLESARIEIEDIKAEMEQAAEHVDVEPARLAFVEERLDTIYRLEDKHHVASVEELIHIRQTLSGNLGQIENIDGDISNQEKEVEKRFRELAKAGEALSATRRKAGEKLQEDLAAHLQALGMPHAATLFDIAQRSQPAAGGNDSVRFLFCSHKNGKPEEVAHIASGGETARLMLALKAVMAQTRNLPTIIFDEIDTGVSGTMAERMAKTMQQISNTTQVIAITHLPQIAAAGTHHYRVFKTENERETTSHIAPLSEAERVREIADMLSGEQLTEEAIDNAKSLLKTSLKKS